MFWLVAHWHLERQHLTQISEHAFPAQDILARGLLTLTARERLVHCIPDQERHGTTIRNVRCRLITEPQPWRGFLFSSQSGADFCTSTIPTRVAISAVMSTSWMPQNLPKWAKASEFGVSERITNGHPVQTVLCERAINWRKDSNQA